LTGSAPGTAQVYGKAELTLEVGAGGRDPAGGCDSGRPRSRQLLQGLIAAPVRKSFMW
jgi:hypothetical protein